MELHLDNEPATRSRHALRDFVLAAQRQDLLEDALLVATELVANAVRHAPGPFEFRATYLGGRLRLEISDGSTAEPQKREAAPDDNGGRGIAIVSTLTDLWGFDRTAAGKTVWAELI